MLNYILKRLLQTIPIVLGVAFITFMLFHWVGGDPIIQLLGPHATASEIEHLRESYGLNAPVWKQFLNYLDQIVHFDFGRSFTTRQNISTMLKQGAGVSLSLTLPAFIMSLLLSILLSILSAFKRNTWICLLYTSPSPRDRTRSRMPSSA